MQEKSKLRYIILIYIFHIEIQLYIETELFRSFKVHIFINKITTQVELCHVCTFRFVFNRQIDDMSYKEITRKPY